MDHDLDDLFGDDTPLQITTPPTSALISHLNECASTGCRQQVAWSKSGIIASLTVDKQGLLLQHLTCDAQNGQWRLSKPYPVEDVALVHGGVELVHLAWDHYTNFLAICDIQGRISVYLLPNVNLAINRLMAWRRCVLDPKDDMSAVVGLAWLPPGTVQGLFARPAVRKEGRFSYTVKQQPIPGPKAPQQKGALVIVTRNSRVKLLSTDKDRWTESRMELEAFGKANGILTLATLCADPTSNSESMLLATHNSLGELCLYRVKIDMAHSNLTSQRLTILRRLSPNSQPGTGGTELTAAQGALLYLEFVPASGDLKVPPLPSILTVFTRVSPDYQGTDSVETLVRSWKIIPDGTSLHPAFNQISAPKSGHDKSNATTKPLRLLKSTEFSMSKAPLVLQHISINSTLAFGWNDGSLDFRDARSLTVLPPDGDDQISGFVTNGFAFPGQGSYVQMALSPNANAVFCVDEHNVPDVAFLQYIGTPGSSGSLDDATVSTITEAFAIQFSLAIRVQNSDDLMGTIQLFTNQYIIPLQLGFVPNLTPSVNFNRSVIAGFLRHLQWDTLLVDNAEGLSGNQGFRAGVAFQAAIGFHGQLGLRATETTVATVLLSLRLISSATSAALKNQGSEEMKRPDMALLFLPLAGWFLSLICHLTDELLGTRKEFEKSKLSPDHIDANLINQQIQQAQSIALPMLFGAVSRSLLRNSCRAMRAIQAETEKHRNMPTHGPLFRDFEIQSRRFPLTVLQFEHLIARVDASVKSAYQSAGVGEAEKKAAELGVFIRGEIPPLFTQAVSQLLFQHLTQLKEEIDEAELYFLDYSNLALTNDAYTRKQNQEHPIDVITKVRLKSRGMAIRRCNRCGSLTEDVMPFKPMSAKSKLSKTCVCGSYWVQLDAEDRSVMQI